MVYKWKDSSRIKADAEKAAEIMNDLADKGQLTAENLVEVSKPEDAPLHNEFEWDDTKAAEAYRKDQARYLIRCLVMEPEKDESMPKAQVRTYFNVTGKTYESTICIVSKPDKRQLLLDAAIKELTAFQQKYQTLEELAGVMQEIDAVKEKQTA